MCTIQAKATTWVYSSVPQQITHFRFNLRTPKSLLLLGSSTYIDYLENRMVEKIVFLDITLNIKMANLLNRKRILITRNILYMDTLNALLSQKWYLVEMAHPQVI